MCWSSLEFLSVAYYNHHGHPIPTDLFNLSELDSLALSSSTTLRTFSISNIPLAHSKHLADFLARHSSSLEHLSILYFPASCQPPLPRSLSRLRSLSVSHQTALPTLASLLSDCSTSLSELRIPASCRNAVLPELARCRRGREGGAVLGRLETVRILGLSWKGDIVSGEVREAVEGLRVEGVEVLDGTGLGLD